MALDLNALRETLDRNLGESNSLPTEPRRQIVVDNEEILKWAIRFSLVNKQRRFHRKHLLNGGGDF